MLQVRKKGLMEQVLEGVSNRELVRQVAKASPRELRQARFPSLARLKKNYPPEKVETAMGVLIQEASSYFESSLPEEKCLDVAAEVSETYYFISLEELLYCLQEMKHSKTYGKLTPAKVLAQVREYSEQRLQDAAEESRSANAQRKDPHDQRYSSGKREAQQKAIQQFRVELAKKQAAAEPAPASKKTKNQ